MPRFRLLPLLFLCFTVSIATFALGQPVGGRIGNLNPPMSSVPDILLGDQSFAYLVRPADLGFTDPGFTLEKVHMLIDFQPQQVPQSVLVSGALAHAVYDPTQDKWVPGEIMCSAPPEQHPIIDPGLVDLVAPVGAAYGCRPMDDHYFIIFNFHGPALGDLAVDGQPQPGIVYMNEGSGWFDMFGQKRTSTGKSIIWGDIITCSAPIGNDPNTWGEVKNLFR